MGPGELLRACAKVVDNTDLPSSVLRVTLAHEDGTGRFPFLGGDTELLNAHDGQKVYSVAVHRVLSHMAQWLKVSAQHSPQPAGQGPKA